jgi:uncharacterized protein YjiS (DUF1127 family)
MGASLLRRPTLEGTKIMAHAITLNDYAAPTGGFLARIRKALAGYRAFVETRAELGALSDRELADLGIARLNIDTVARQAARLV